LVETRPAGPERSLDVLELGQLRDLRDIADLGMTSAEARQLLSRVQQAVIAAQSQAHAVHRPTCSSCGGHCRVKDWRHHQVATLFGTASVRLPRFCCVDCGHCESGLRWPSHCRSTPALDELRAHLSALMPYRVAADVLGHLLPIEAGIHHETLRSHTLKAGEQLLKGATEQDRRTIRRQSRSALIRLSSTAVTMANGISRFAWVMSRLPSEAGRFLPRSPGSAPI